MSIYEPIIFQHTPAATHDGDDIHTLLSQAGMAAFPYRNISQQEALAVQLTRWPLLVEILHASSEQEG